MEIPAYRGSRIPVLQSAACQTTLATGVLAHIPFEMASQISLVYSVQDKLQEGVDRAFQVSQMGVASTKQEHRALFGSILGLGPEVQGFYTALGTELLAEHGFACDQEAPEPASP
ncbi:MAG: hypothetical protein AAGI71_15820 [Bacteroidota bacterium]